MNRAHLRRSDAPSVRSEWATPLGLGPWLWPPDGHPDLPHALSIVSDGPPPLRQGDTPLVSVSPDKTTVSLWKLRPQKPGAGTKDTTAFSPQTEKRWDEVVSWLPRLVPMLWRPVAGVAHLKPAALRLGGWAGGADEVDEEILDGRSFGLSFALAAASLVFSHRLQDDVLATADVRDGALAPVSEITLKVRGCVALAPRIRRLLVHPDNADEARAAADGALTVVPVTSVCEAIEAALGRRLESVLLKSGHDTAAREELAREFFNLATTAHQSLVDWRPVRRAAETALERWPQTPTTRRHFAMAAAVAHRHEANLGVMRLPDRRWLAALPRPIRLQVIASLVSQATYAASPPPERMLEIARRTVNANMHEASVQDLRVLGAMARHDAVMGRPQESLRQQLQLGAQFLRLGELKDLTFPLAACYRLSGALHDATAFETTEQMETKAALAAILDPKEQAFVTFARAQALVSFGRTSEAMPLLERIADNSPKAVYLRWSALRWLLKARPGVLVGAQAEAWWARLRAGADDVEGRATGAPFYLGLASLDYALFAGDMVSAAAALSTTQAAEPGVVGHLVSAARRLRTDAPTYVATFYPD